MVRVHLKPVRGETLVVSSGLTMTSQYEQGKPTDPVVGYYLIKWETSLAVSAA